VTRAALPHLVEQGGHVFMISSLAGQNAIAGMAAYCASKAALDQFAACLMLEVRHQGVKVTTLAPGSVDTDFGGDARAGSRPAGGARAPPPEPRGDAPAAASAQTVIRRAARLAWRAFMRYQDHNGPD